MEENQVPHSENGEAEKPRFGLDLKQSALNVCKGAIIGVGAILPGISGGLLSLVFGIYRPMMRFLSHPIKAFREYWRLLLPVLIGWIAGFLGLARLVDVLFRTSPVPATWLFIGLIAGTLPSMFRTAGEKGRTAGSWAALVLCFAVFLSLMLFFSISAAIQVEASVGWWIVCGIFWGLGLIVPGLSPSTFIIFLGLYQPMTAGLAALSPEIILPLAAGIVLTVLLLARLVNRLFERAHSIVYHGLFGVVLASTIAIIPVGASYGPLDILIYALCFTGGCAAAMLLDRLGGRVKSKSEGESEQTEE